jgi:hypothetical protein
MKKIFQTIIDKDHGNCEQATIASLLELELNEVPNFIEYKEKSWSTSVVGFLSSKGFDVCCINRRRDRDTTEFLKKVAKFDGGYKGYFHASVLSQTFPDVDHAVIIDVDLNIVHDPNPNQRALKLTPDDVESFITMHPMVIGKTGKLFTEEEWDNATEEEKDLNTWRADSTNEIDK